MIGRICNRSNLQMRHFLLLSRRSLGITGDGQTIFHLKNPTSRPPVNVMVLTLLELLGDVGEKSSVAKCNKRVWDKH
ncbi:hypothetical protein Pla52n_12520 [Stieleria varia]|uniref:Uncharacterized protein n=1 Tax=Stieleria varia TaxID=2528005 RepID=A0A5C6B0U9_9BACT|nr:hypothetical protein Pla52n_12520 [Stieleria varia]